MIGFATPQVKGTPRIGVPFAALPLEVMGRRDLTAAAKLVFAAIANHARMRRGTDSTLTNAQVAEMVGMTPGSVRRPLDELRAAGLVQCLYGVSERVRTAIRVTFTPSKGVATQTTTPAPKVARTAQHGCDPGRGVVAIPTATPSCTKREEPSKTPGVSPSNEKPESSPPLSAEGIAAAIADGMRQVVGGEHAAMIFDVEPSTPTASTTKPSTTSTAKPATTPTTPATRTTAPYNGLDLRRVGVSAVAACFSPAFGAVRNTPEKLNRQIDELRARSRGPSPAPGPGGASSSARPPQTDHCPESGRVFGVRL